MIAASVLAVPVNAATATQGNSTVQVSQAESAVAVPGAELEERTIVLRHHWTRREIKVVYKLSGVYQPEAMAQINTLLRDGRCDKTIDIDPALIDLLYELHQALGARGPIRIVSAYRSEGYNASLLRAGRNVDPNSQHMQGHAADIVIPGIRGEAVRDMAIKLGKGGVGYYPYSWPNFVHVDTGPVRQWIEADPKAQPVEDRRQQKRFKLDCNLTMAEVFTEISREKVLATLPPGAVVEASAPIGGVALRSAANVTDATVPTAAPLPATTLPRIPDAASHEPAYACQAAEPLPLLARLPRHRMATAAHRLRKTMARRNARHHRRARRGHR